MVVGGKTAKRNHHLTDLTAAALPQPADRLPVQHRNFTGGRNKDASKCAKLHLLSIIIGCTPYHKCVSIHGPMIFARARPQTAAARRSGL